MQHKHAATPKVAAGQGFATFGLSVQPHACMDEAHQVRTNHHMAWSDQAAQAASEAAVLHKLQPASGPVSTVCLPCVVRMHAWHGMACRATDPKSAEFYRRVLLGFVSINQHATNLLFVAVEVALHA